MSDVGQRWLRWTARGTVFLLAFVIAATGETGAQSLDIGGIELRLGQDVSAALQQFATYKVVYSEGLKSWFVSQELPKKTEWLGHFKGENGRVTAITKGFTLSNETELASVYTAALNETRRRGGQVCEVRNVEYTDDLVRSIETHCGRYVLSYSFPFASGEDVVSAGISLRVSEKPRNTPPP